MSEVVLPVVQGLSRKSEHQIDADIVDALPAQGIDCPVHLGRCVASTEEVQPSVVESLGPHAHPVDGQMAGQPLRNIVGIALHRHLGAGSHRVHLIYIGEQSVELGGRELAWRAAAEVDCGELGAFGAQLHLAAQSLYIAVAQPGERGGVEPAVDAAARTERNMDVKACHKKRGLMVPSAQKY